MFTIITIALIALSFFVHDTIVTKSVAWESAIDVSSITKKDISREDLMYRPNILNDKLNSEALFIRNSSANICAAGDKIEVSISSMFKMNFSFWNNRKINTVTSTERVFSATELRKIKAMKNTLNTIIN